MAKPYRPPWALVPPELLSFVKSPSLSTLVEALQEHPRLYWHPLVMRQIGYLRRLRHQWRRLGYEEDDEGPYPVREVRVQFERILDAHLRGVLPDRRMTWQRLKKRPGRRGGLKNPYPTGDWSDRVEARTLDASERELRQFFKARSDQLERMASESR